MCVIPLILLTLIFREAGWKKIGHKITLPALTPFLYSSNIQYSLMVIMTPNLFDVL